MIGKLHSSTIRFMSIFFIVIMLLCSVFIGVYFWTSNKSSDNQQYIAKINGQGINKEAFEREASIKLKNSLSFGDNNMELSIRRNLLLDSIGSYLLFALSEDLKLAISDNEINRQIQSNKLFFVDGVFNNQRYVQLLSANGFTPDVYAESLKTDFKKKQLSTALVVSDFVLPVDLELSLLQKQQRTIYAAEFSFWNMVDKDQTFPEDKLISFYNSLAPRYFSTEDLFKLDTLKISKGQIIAQVKKDISDNDVKKYFKDNRKKYIKPEEYSLSVIEIDNKDTAKRVYKDLNNGMNFEKIAEEFAYYPIQKQSKGFIGWFSKNELPSEIVKANLSLKNQISSPVLQDDGHYLIFKLNNIKKPMYPDYDTIFPQIRYDLVQIRFDERLRNLQSQLRNLIDENIPLEDIAKQVDGVIQVTPWIDMKNNMISDSAIHNDMNDSFGDTTKWNTLFGPIYIPQDEAVYVFKIKDFQKAGTMPFEKVRDDVLNGLRVESAKQRFHQKAEDIVKTLNNEGQYNGIQFAKKFVLSRKAIEFDQSVNDMVFSLVQPGVGRRYGITYINPEVSVIAVLTKIDTPTEVDDISAELSPIIIDNMKSSLIQDLYSKAKVEIMPDSKL